MKQIIQKVLARYGYGLRKLDKLEQNSRAFVPFVRDIKFLDVSLQMWITNRDAVEWYDEQHSMEWGELHAFRTLAKPGDRVLEFGSHHGFTGMLLAKFVEPGGCVYSIEAHPNNAMIAQAQLGLNRSITNLRFANVAASNLPGKVKITPSHNSSVTDVTNGSIEVPAVTGDMLDEEHGPFDFLKVDVEGYEIEVLKGCRKLLSRAPKIALEIHMEDLRERGQSLASLLDLIDVDRYEGQMIIRPEKYRDVVPFDPARIPENCIANVLLKPK